MGKYKAMAKRMGINYKRKVATVQTVKRMIGKSLETKLFDDLGATTTSGNTWSVSCKSNVAQGDAINNRTGNKISPTYFRYRIQMAVDANNTLGDIVRVVIFSDKEARGVVPTMSNLNLPNTAAGGSSIALDTTNQYTRYKILSDRVYNMSTDNNYQVKSGAIKLKSPMKFGTEADDYQENSIFVAVWSYDNTNKASITCNSRLFFKDG